MKLAIFDVDGTLTATSKVDADCYVRAVREIHGITIAGNDWSQFKSYSDSGIFYEVFEAATGRPPTDAEHDAVRTRFMQLLRSRSEESPELFVEIPGASAMMENLRRRHDWSMAMATGCWRISAEFKLKLAGLKGEGLPLAACDDYRQRETIMRDAYKQACELNQVGQFQRVVYIGDGIWDARGSKNLGFAFVGIQHEGHHRTLAGEGASHIMPDYTNYETFLDALEHAEMPS